MIASPPSAVFATRVADQAGDEVARDRAAVLGAVAEDRGEQHEEQRREEEDEDRGLAAAPEDQLLGPELVPEEASSRSSSGRGRGRRPRASRGAPRAPPARSPRRARARSARAARASARRSRARPPRRAAGSGSARSALAISSDGLPSLTISPARSTATPVGELLRLVEVVGRQQDRLAELAQRADQRPGVPPRRRVEAGRRLVEEDEVGIADERDAEVEPPLLAARERLHLRVPLLGEPDEPDHLVDVARVRRSSRRRSGAPRARSASARARTAAGRRRSARGTPARCGRGRSRARCTSPASRFR